MINVDTPVAANRALVERFREEIFNWGNLDAADQIVAPDFEWNSPGFPEFSPGAPAVKRFAGALRAAFPNLHLTLVETIAEGDKVVDHWIATGTQKAEWLGIPATGKTVSIAGIDIFRIRDGKIVQLRQIIDLLGALRELGVLPPVSLPRV